ncbi:acetate--CoA ligase family protein [Neoroseomonas soli]|uniref:Acetate--CoA ligase family protein n=1 Tax=Neoroseomonas soli TaxID=1081025 RepID=A0A9X9WQZ0_9PROT|nr:acetate--CoA ligase family protein [Neoroseomonas soli]MBR0669569.1 acetate--CoA ligase family protein [Neoroseomonas soli]
MSLTSRAVYRHGDMRRLFDPASIAVIGASPRAGSFADRTIQALKDYTGRLYLVNSRYEKIGERACFPSVAALPEAPDCCIVVAAKDAVEEIATDCAKAGVGGIMIYASGYRETGREDDIAAQDRLTEIGRAAGMRIVGPNCIGMLNFGTKAGVTFMIPPPMERPLPHAVGLISQSGALGFSLAQAVMRGVSVSHLLTTGNSSDVDVADCVSFLADDPNCAAIGCVFEGMPDPMRFIHAAEIADAANKPLVVFKLGTGEAGAAAAMSHTGSLAGENAAYLAAFERAGAIVVQDFEALVETSSFLAKAPAPKARGVAVVAVSGGAAIMSADKAEARGVPLPQPTPPVQAILESRIPDFGSARNPCDVTAQVANDPESLTACASAMLGDEHYGALIYAQIYSTELSAKRPGELAAIAEQHDKPICVVWTTEWLEGTGSTEAERNPRIGLFRSMDRCFATLAHWHAREARRAAGPRAYTRLSRPEAKAEAAALIAASQDRTLTEREAKAVLAAYGVPVVPEKLTQSEDAAVAAAEALGFPVAMKVESPDLPHKTEAGVIRLRLKDAADVREAYRAVMANAKHHAPHARINGVLVQPMAKPGVEVMVGARVDPLMGPLIVAGLGGVLVELMRDSTLALAPVTPAEARAMFGRLRGRAALEGFRGAPAADLDRLAEIVARLSEFVADQRDRVAELDVNPIIVAGSDAVAVDALIVKA